jgi:hypothetical protein
MKAQERIVKTEIPVEMVKQTNLDGKIYYYIKKRGEYVTGSITTDVALALIYFDECLKKDYPIEKVIKNEMIEL